MPSLEEFPTIGRILVVTVIGADGIYRGVPCIVVDNQSALGLAVVAFQVPVGFASTPTPAFGPSPSVGIYPVGRGRPEDVATERGFHRWVWPREVMGAGKIDG